MIGYRLYLMSGDGHILRAVELTCENDSEALEQAEGLAQGQAAELWNQARLVGRLTGGGRTG